MSAEDVAKLTENYKELRHDVNELRQGVSNATSSLFRIETALVGDTEMMHIGIVDTIRTNTKAISDIKIAISEMQKDKELEDSIKKNDKWWIAGIASGITGAGAYVINLFTK